jgi:hypothetical protein
MRWIVAAFISFLVVAQPAVAQCTAPGCEEATAVVSAARATARAVLTREAPPTPTPLPTSTPWPTVTPAPTQTPQPTATETALPTSTAEPTATQEPTQTATPAPAAEQPQRGAGLPVELWCIVGILLICGGVGIAMRMVSKWLKR